jgi:hypothetical protein
LHEIKTDIAIIGGGTGGIAAALAALKMGRRVLLSEETDWIGGQFTAQAVPPDESPWVEQAGCTRSYRQFRDDVREYYRRWYPLTDEARQTSNLNPGAGWVSRLCVEPRAVLAVLESYLLPYQTSGQLQILLHNMPISATTDGDRITSVTLRDQRDGEEIIVQAPYFLDATELGELLELAAIESVTGAESQAQTGEPHAPLEAQPLNQQSITYCFAVSHHEGENHVIARPREYSFWQNYKAGFWPDKNLSWQQTHPVTLATRYRSLFPKPDSDGWEPLWRYRRIVANDNHRVEMPDISLVNWPQIDYWLGPLVGVSEEEKQKHIEGAKQLSLCFLYWMQTEAPRHDGGEGYPGLKIRGDITGTKDGLAKYAYIRESRRIQAEFTVCEQHVASALRENGAEKFADSVGIGSYRIDLHPSTGKSGDGSDGDNYIDVGSWPFEIPLGSLIPVRVENVLPACKNLGVTHITNGCYRLHPVEWNIGEAAGALAAHCLDRNETPRGVRNTPQKLEEFRGLLAQQGFELSWPEFHAV